MCDRPVLWNEHRGNTFSEIKYAMHCDTEEVLDASVRILSRIGFIMKNQETDDLKHTFMVAPRWLVPQGSFHYVLVIKPGGNTQQLLDGKVQSVHLGFRTTIPALRQIHRRICSITDSTLIDKPDESSLFIQLPCGEVIEIAGLPCKFPLRAVMKTVASIAVLSALWL
jgi:hypothetical protein